MIEIESDWKKHAAQVYSDKDVEKAFLDQAYMFIQNKATPLMQDPYRLGFEIVFKNDANSKMVGIFAFKVGEELIYAPAFFVNGAIKGTDLLYRHKSKTFVPLTNDWATYLVGIQQNKSGSAIAKGHSTSDGLNVRKIILPPDYSQGTVKTASYNKIRESNDWLPNIEEVYEEIKEAGSEEKKANVLKDLILDVGQDAVKKITDVMEKDATFANNVLQHVGLDNVLLEEVKEAHVKEAATHEKGLVLHMGFANENVKQASEKMAANGFLFEDNRPETDLVHSVFEDKNTEYSGVSEAGIYKVLRKDGTTCNCLVVPSNGHSITSSFWYDDEDDMDLHQRSGGSRGYGSTNAKYTVVDLSNNAYKCVDSKKIITADEESEKATDAENEMDRFSDTPSPGGYYMLLDLSKGVNGSTISDPFYVKSTVSSGDGVNKYRVDWSDDSYGDESDLPTLTLNPDYDSNNYKDKVFKKGDVAFVKVDKKKDVDLASSSDLHNLFVNGGVKSASVHKTDMGFVTKSGSHTTSEQSKLSTLCYLMKAGSFTEDLAENLIKKAEEQGVVSFYIPKTAHNLSFGENPDDYFTEDMDDVFGISRQSPQSVRLIADSAEPDMPDDSRIGDSIKFDNAGELEGKGPNELAAMADQLGVPSLFEHGVVGSLANTYDSRMLIDKYFPDLEKALDRLGRMVFLFYWKPEDFSHLYGTDDQSSLENMLVSNFKQFGELVLELLKKINSFTETAGRTY
tara:strand:- start:612 stop:2825 length:2214 start_codon:yes stop_codon:yes gene_type:complete